LVIWGKDVPVLNSVPEHEDVLGNGGIAPPSLTSKLDRGEWSPSHLGHFTHGERGSNTLVTLPLGKEALDRRLSGPLSQSKHYDEEKNLAAARN
jgi:hypothetical protein